MSCWSLWMLEGIVKTKTMAGNFIVILKEFIMIIPNVIEKDIVKFIKVKMAIVMVITDWFLRN